MENKLKILVKKIINNYYKAEQSCSNDICPIKETKTSRLMTQQCMVCDEDLIPIVKENHIHK